MTRLKTLKPLLYAVFFALSFTIALPQTANAQMTPQQGGCTYTLEGCHGKAGKICPVGELSCQCNVVKNCNGSKSVVATKKGCAPSCQAVSGTPVTLD